MANNVIECGFSSGEKCRDTGGPCIPKIAGVSICPRQEYRKGRIPKEAMELRLLRMAEMVNLNNPRAA